MLQPFVSLQICYCADMVSVTSTSRFRSPWKVDPPRTAEVDSMELADVRADWGKQMYRGDVNGEF